MINENKLRQAILSDFENLLVAEFTADWKNKRFLIEMYLSVMNLDNTKKFICSLNETQQEKIVDYACGESYVGE